MSKERAGADELRWASLMVAAQAGDGAAYATLLRDCVPFIRRIVIGVGAEADSADDVVQDVLLTIHRARHTYDPAYPFSPWLRTVAQRRTIDALRIMGRRRNMEVHAPDAFDNHEDSALSALSLVERGDSSGRLHDALTDLPAGQREAIELLGLAELTLAEASAQTGRSTTALKVNLHRAIKSLRKLMAAGSGR